MLIHLIIKPGLIQEKSTVLFLDFVISLWCKTMWYLSVKDDTVGAESIFDSLVCLSFHYQSTHGEYKQNSIICTDGSEQYILKYLLIQSWFLCLIAAVTLDCTSTGWIWWLCGGITRLFWLTQEVLKACFWCTIRLPYVWYYYHGERVDQKPGSGSRQSAILERSHWICV